MDPTIETSIVSRYIDVTKATEAQNKSTEAALRKRAYENYTKIVYNEINKESIETILEVEQSILLNDLGLASDQREIDSLKAGLDRMEEALCSLNNIFEYQNFVTHLKGCGRKVLDSNGLPRDGFRFSVASQIVSLQNNTRDNKPKYIRDFIDIRTNALKYADKLYRATQIKYMLKFSKDNPENIMCRSFLAILAKQRHLAKNRKKKDKEMEI